MARPEAARAAGRPMRSLQRRLMAGFALFALCLVTLYSLYALVFAYTVEDRFLADSLAHEARRQQARMAATGETTRPEDPNTRLIFDAADFPDDLRPAFEREPHRREFAGSDGRHYHLHPVVLGERTGWLVAEVSDRLVFRQMRSQVVAILGGSALSALALALLIGAWIARRTTRPLSRLADAVAALDPDQLAQTAALHRPDAPVRTEVDVLARGIDGLVQRVQAFISREQAFTRDVGHELRTPLAVIRNLSEQLAASENLSERERGQLESIRQSTDTLQQTVTTLLSLARETHRAESMSHTTVLPVLERVIVEQAALHSDPALALHVAVPATITARLSESVLHILLSNLIGNALAHAEAIEPGGARPVDIEVIEQRLCIRNRAEAAPGERDFAEFHKRDGSAGHGLGLAIVRRLCDRFGVDLRVEHRAGRAIISIPVDEEAGSRV